MSGFKHISRSNRKTIIMLSIDTWFWRYKDPNYIMEQCFFWELLFIVKVAIIHRYRKNDNHNMEDLTKYGYKS